MAYSASDRESFPGLGAKSTADLEKLTAKQIQHLPRQILEPIIRKGHAAAGLKRMSAEAMKEAVAMVHRGHWVHGLPGKKVTDQDLDDLF
jgi:hypothetical protein